jgi:dTDP-4-amino-4,6-dideoxygalactose transaminase
MRLHGISRDAFDRFTSTKPSWHYEIVAPGFKYNLTDIASAIGIHQLKKAQQFQERRAEIAATYDDAFGRLPIVLPPKPSAADSHAWHLYVIQLGPETAIDRDFFIEQMHSRGVGVSVHYIPLHLQPYWRDTYGLRPGAFPVSERVYRRAVSLPIYSKMTDDDVQRVVSAVQSLVG